MIEILPIKLLTDEDALIFGSLNVALGKLQRAGLPVGSGIVITPPNLKLKTTLEHYDFGAKESFEQSLILVKKEINSIPVPQALIQETGKHKQFFLNGEKVKGLKNLWLALLTLWLDQVKNRLWNNGFYCGITDGLDPQAVVFIKKLESSGTAFFDPLQDDVAVNTRYKSLDPKHMKEVADLVQLANKRLFIPHEYEWVLDNGIKLTGLKQYTPAMVVTSSPIVIGSQTTSGKAKRSAVKVFLELSRGMVAKNIDGIYLDSGKIFDLNKPKESFEDMVLKLVESASAFSNCPVLFKLADKSEGMGKVRGALRLIHQKSLSDPLLKALDFARHKKGLINVHTVIPFIRNVSELLQIKRELAIFKLMRKNSLQIWMEAAVPENIINLEDYLAAGVDGVVLNLDELVAYLNGFDISQEDLLFYKNEVTGLIKFLSTAIQLLHKSKIPFIAYSSLNLHPKVLEFLVETGVYGIVVENSWFHSAHDLLYQAEKRMILKRS